MLIMLLPPTLTPRSNATNTFEVYLRIRRVLLKVAFSRGWLYHLPTQKYVTSQKRCSSQFGSVHPRYKRLATFSCRDVQSACSLEFSIAQWRTLPTYNQQQSALTLEVI